MYFDCHLDALVGSPELKQNSYHTVKLIMSKFDLIVTPGECKTQHSGNLHDKGQILEKYGD